MFDEPILNDTEKILPRCNECGYMIKAYAYGGTQIYNATCGKHIIMTDSIERPRVIQRNVVGNHAAVYRPDWCPKIMTATPETPKLALPAPVNKPVTYDDYYEKRNKMKELPSVCDWTTLKEGDICVVPRILRQKRRIIMVKKKNEFVLNCVVLDDNLEATSTFTNIYSNDIDVNFIVKLHKF
jgi:hypothetical protein